MLWETYTFYPLNRSNVEICPVAVVKGLSKDCWQIVSVNSFPNLHFLEVLLDTGVEVSGEKELKKEGTV